MSFMDKNVGLLIWKILRLQYVTSKTASQSSCDDTSMLNLQEVAFLVQIKINFINAR